MIKKFFARILLILFVVNIIDAPVQIQATETVDVDFGYYEIALKLQKLGVFLGDDNGFRLGDTSNRLESLVILIRLLGKEESAKESTNTESVFSDVPTWGIPYVNYAVEQGLSNGIGGGLFGSSDRLTPEAFVTFLLRALGYSDAKGDFFWEDSLSFANGIGLISDELLNEVQSGELIRNIIAKLSYETLAFSMKEGNRTLIDYLVEEGSIPMDIAIETGLLVVDEPIEEVEPNEDAEPSKEDNVNNEEKEPDVYLQGPPSATKEQVEKWARSRGMSEEGISLIDIYFELCVQKGLDPVIQYVQMCHETGFLYKVKSQAGLDASFHNPCGLKTTVGGGDYEANAHMRFETWYDGIDAHTDHSALYAGIEGYPRVDTKDPRHFKYLFGIGPTVREMGISWASNVNYQEHIMKLYRQLLATE